MADEVLIDHILVFEGSLGQLLEIDREVLEVPSVLLNLTQLNPLDRIGLEHAADKVFAVGGDFNRHPIVSLLNFHEQDG